MRLGVRYALAADPALPGDVRHPAPEVDLGALEAARFAGTPPDPCGAADEVRERLAVDPEQVDAESLEGVDLVDGQGVDVAAAGGALDAEAGPWVDGEVAGVDGVVEH